MTTDDIMVNAAARTLVRNGQVCAFVITGSDKVASGYGNGDCLLLDFGRALFALSDSAERYPAASRDLLARFVQGLGGADTPDTPDGWLAAVNSAYAGQPYHHKTTFCCAILEGSGPESALTVLHGGDSIVYVACRESGEILFRTAPNMDFAGRSPAIHHIERVPLGRGTERVVLCSDGLADMAKNSGFSGEEFMRQVFTREIETIPERVRDLAGAWDGGGRSGHFDDVGVIVFEPARLERSHRMRLLMGGTMPHHERDFQASGIAQEPGERWVRANDLAQHAALMERCGIVMV
jgi:hypothetical protein